MWFDCLWGQMGGGWGWGMMGFGWVFALLLVVVVVALLAWGVWVVTRLVTGERDDRGRGLEILDERLARGELSIEEYRERRAVLEERR